MVDVVSVAAGTIFAPASWCSPAPGEATESTSPEAFGPMRYTDGYFMVRRDPMLPSIQATCASASARARFVTRLYTFFDQFWMVVYVMREPSNATSSTTAECRESVVYTGAEHPST